MNSQTLLHTHLRWFKPRAFAMAFLSINVMFLVCASNVRSAEDTNSHSYDFSPSAEIEGEVFRQKLESVSLTLAGLSDTLVSISRQLAALDDRLEELRRRADSVDKDLKEFRVGSVASSRRTDTELKQLTLEQARLNEGFQTQIKAIEKLAGELTEFSREYHEAFETWKQSQALWDTSNARQFDRTKFLLHLAVTLILAQLGLLAFLLVLVLRSPRAQRVPVKMREVAESLVEPDRPVEDLEPLKRSRLPSALPPCLPQKRSTDIQHLPVPNPDHLLARLATAALRWHGVQLKLATTDKAPWFIGSSSHRGHVRSENQDYTISFTMGPFQVGLLADGLGGLPHGKQAAYIAIRAAALSLIRQMASDRDPLHMAKAAMTAASKRLSQVAFRFNLKPENGLRTTLIVCVGSASKWSVAYCGDGGTFLVRRSGKIASLLVPQKASPSHPNVLAASLGPLLQGMAESVECLRLPGDFMVLMTDGVADRVPATFAMDLLHAARESGGNLQRVTDQVLGELAEAKDQLGYICDDNMSMICLADRIPSNYFPPSTRKGVESEIKAAVFPTPTNKQIEVST